MKAIRDNTDTNGWGYTPLRPFLKTGSQPKAVVSRPNQVPAADLVKYWFLLIFSTVVLSMLTSLKIGYSLYLATLWVFFFLVASQLWWDLCFLTRDGTCTPCWKHKVIITGPARKVQQLILDPNIPSLAERPDGELVIAADFSSQMLNNVPQNLF